tara:strand:- start:266 stop:421 length:156 start_codon:yes stop_codon:yes gene_type:complete
LEKFEKTINCVSNKRENFDLSATSTQGYSLKPVELSINFMENNKTDSNNIE